MKIVDIALASVAYCSNIPLDSTSTVWDRRQVAFQARLGIKLLLRGGLKYC